MAASELVPLQDALDFLGLESPDSDELVAGLIAASEEELLRATGRGPGRGFSTGSARDERYDGTGSRLLVARAPIASISQLVQLGRDSANPDEELDASDPDELTFEPGSRNLYRTDGGVFGELDSPRYVRLRYTSADELPELARLAVLRRVAVLYRETGRPEATSERAVEDTEGLPFVADADPIWQDAVRLLSEPRV